MAQAYVFVCQTQNGTTINNGIGLAADARQVPHCPGTGTWQTITYAEPAGAFNPADLDPATLAQAFGSGFVVVSVGLLLAFALRLIIHMVRNA